jgi:phage-related protein
MLNETFYLDGIDARSAGIQLQAPIEFSEAVPVVEAQTIPGRNGDLIWETGSYENRSGSASCFCLQKNVEKAISSAGLFLMGKKGYRRLETSDDPDHYWMARVENSPQIAMRLRTLAPFDIGFDCKPQRFLKDGENAVVFTESGSIFNQYGQVSLPFITLYGNGAGWLTIGKITISVTSLDGTLYLDSETQNAYNNNGNQNMNIIAPVFPVLPDGESIVAWGGNIERVEIVPRWWEL